MNINLELTIQYDSPNIDGVPNIVIRNVLDAIVLVQDNKQELEELRRLLHEGLARIEKFQARIALPGLKKDPTRFDTY